MEGNHPYIDTTKFINEQSPKYVGEHSLMTLPVRCLGDDHMVIVDLGDEHRYSVSI